MIIEYGIFFFSLSLYIYICMYAGLKGNTLIYVIDMHSIDI